VEIGHRSTSTTLLANIAYHTQAHLAWDAQKEQFTNNPAANKLLSYEYRPLTSCRPRDGNAAVLPIFGFERLGVKPHLRLPYHAEPGVGRVLEKAGFRREACCGSGSANGACLKTWSVLAVLREDWLENERQAPESELEPPPKARAKPAKRARKEKALRKLRVLRRAPFA